MTIHHHVLLSEIRMQNDELGARPYRMLMKDDRGPYQIFNSIEDLERLPQDLLDDGATVRILPGLGLMEMACVGE